MPTPTQLTLKDRNSGKALAKVEEPTTLKVVVLDLIEDLLAKVYVEKNDKQSYTGYITKAEYDELNVSSVTIPESFAGLEAVAVPTRLKEQLFRIYSVEENEDYVTVKARHVWYDNLQNYTLWKPTEDTQYTGAAVCRNILTNAISQVDSNVASDCTDEKPGSEFDYERKNLVECFLDPENGVCAKYGLSLIRDNWDFYCLKDVGYDRGYVIQTGKNLLGVVRDESIENVVTRTCPIGMDAKGDIVWLSNDGKKYVDSQYINDYSYPRLEIFDTGLQIGQDGVTAENINAKLLEAGQKRFSDDKVDLPEVTMTIDFLSIGDTEEYAQYRGLDKVYLYDIVTIKDTVRGYEYAAQVVGVEHDILTGMLMSITLGKIENSDGVRKIATWQVPEVSGENIRLKTIMAGAFYPGAINADDIATGAIQWIHIDAASITQLTTEQLEALTANIHTLIAGSITADDINATSIRAAIIAAGAISANDIDANSIRTAILDAGKISAADIDAASVRAGIISAGKITSADIEAGTIKADNIDTGAITTAKLDAYAVTAAKIAVGAVEADKIATNAVTAAKIDANDLTAIQAKLQIANIASAQIASADIGYAQVKELNAQSAYFGQAVIQSGLANKLYVPRLSVGYAQMIGATVGDLVIQASNGNFYALDVDLSGNVTATQRTVTAGEIASGHTSDGRQLVMDTDILAENLTTNNLTASHALMYSISANIIDVDQLWARQAFIDKLMVQDISSNTYIQSTIGNWQSQSTITQTVNSLDSRISSLGYGTVYMQPDEPDHSHLSSGDVWIQTLADTTWQEIYDNTTDFPSWQAIYNNVSTWQTLGAIPIMWVWDGRNFQLMYDALMPTNVETEIQQLATAITLKASMDEVNLLSDEVTEFRAQLTIQADEIEAAVSAVNQKCASYVMWSDPRTAYSVSLGDIWVKRDDEFCDQSSWQDVYNNFTSWNELYNTHDSWGDMLGDRTFMWDGTAWIETSDRASDIYQKTLIDETTTRVTILAETTATINGTLYELNASLVVANDRISQEVSRATTAENRRIEKTEQYQTAAEIVSAAVSQAQGYGDQHYVEITGQYQTAGSIITEAVRTSALNVAPEFSTSTAYAVGDIVSKDGKVYRFKTAHPAGAWNSAHVDEINTTGAYIAKTNTYQTADAIYTEAVKNSAANIAPAFSTSTAYAIGDLVSYNGAVYRFNTAHSAGAWNGSQVDRITTNGAYIAKTSSYQTAEQIVTEAVRSSSTNVAPAFSATTSYAVGDIVSYNGSVYKFKVAHAAGAWNSSQVDMITTKDAFIAKTSSYQTADSIITEATKRSSAVVAPEFSQSTSYAVGDMVSYGGKVYVFNTAHSAGAWNSAQVTETTSVGSFIAKTSTYQTADSIKNEAVKTSSKNIAPEFSTSTNYNVGDLVIYYNRVYRFTQYHSAGVWNGAQVEMITTQEAFIQKTSTYQTAAQISLDAKYESAKNVAPQFKETVAYSKDDIVSHLGKVWKFRANKTAGAWNVNFVDQINLEENVYQLRSYIDIIPAGIEMSGGKYLKFIAAGSTKVSLDATGIVMDTAGKFVLHAKDASNSSITFGTDVASATFAVGETGDVRCHNLLVNGDFTVNGKGLPRIEVSSSEPSGSNLIWIQPGNASVKNIYYTPGQGELVLSTPGGIGYYRDFTIPYTANDYVSGTDLYYGIKVKLQFYSLSGYESDTFKASIKVGETWYQIGTVTATVGQWATLELDTMITSTIPSAYGDATGGSMKIRLESTASDAKAMLLNEDIILKVKNTSTSTFSVCTVRYKQ